MSRTSRNYKIGFFLVIFTLIILSIGNIVLSYISFEEEQTHFAKAESKILSNFMLIHRKYYQKLFFDNTIKLNKDTLKALPAFSTYEISKNFSTKNRYDIKVQTVSDRARNPKNRADNIEKSFIEYFKKHKDQNEYFKYISDVNKPYYQYGYALRIEKACLKCHSKRDKAPFFISKKYDKAYGYQLNDIRGIISVKIPKKQAYDYLYDRFIKNMFFNISLLVLTIFIISFYFYKKLAILKRLKMRKVMPNLPIKANLNF